MAKTFMEIFNQEHSEKLKAYNERERRKPISTLYFLIYLTIATIASPFIFILASVLIGVFFGAAIIYNMFLIIINDWRKNEFQ